ncbi:hypothetical protein DVH24_032432 [Malus domestica]|uniref:Uncharacterized protein n=2 Tax=Malus TaxID=3749 RepID=A0A498J5S1_MALDO|nr:uncharacterized protein LOC103444614 [Malus domestica]RXH90075.1 hypothetical protein DVH24_032432 [Malus domestica]
MWSMLATMRQNLHNIRKSPRVADESMVNVGAGNPAPAELPIFPAHHDHHHVDRRSLPRIRWIKGFNSLLYSVVLVPFSVISCFSQPHHVHGADGVWASGEFSQITEMNQLMVSDSMRYAILM